MSAAADSQISRNKRGTETDYYAAKFYALYSVFLIIIIIIAIIIIWFQFATRYLYIHAICNYIVWDQARFALWTGNLKIYNARDQINSDVSLSFMRHWDGFRLEIFRSSVNVPLPSLKIRRSILPCNFVYSLFSALDRIAMSGEG